MDHDEPSKPVDQWSRTQPGEKPLPIRGLQHLVESVLVFGLGDAGGSHEQVQIVVPEHHSQTVAMLPGPAQNLKGPWTAVDQVADQPKIALTVVPSDAFEQTLESLKAAVDVANNPGRHQLTLYRHSRPRPCPRPIFQSTRESIVYHGTRWRFTMRFATRALVAGCIVAVLALQNELAEKRRDVDALEDVVMEGLSDL